MRIPTILSAALLLMVAACEKPQPAPRTLPEETPTTVQPELADPASTIDPRQATQNRDIELKKIKERLDEIEKVNKRGEILYKASEEILQEITAALEKLDRRCGELERENQTLRNKIDAGNSNGFQQ